MLSNLDKVLYPEAGCSPRAQVLDYYTRIAPLLLPHLHGRPLTRKRYPNGVDAAFFFEKNVPRGLPEWVRTARLPSPGSTKDRDEIDFMIVDELATLVYVANLASLELHTPMWQVGPRGAARPPDMLVIDLDPGPPATIVECCRVARARARGERSRLVSEDQRIEGHAALREGGQAARRRLQLHVRRDPHARRAAGEAASRTWWSAG